MTELEMAGDIEDKKLFYEAAKEVALRAAERVSKLEKTLEVEKRHAAKMADRQNKALRELREVLP